MKDKEVKELWEAYQHVHQLDEAMSSYDRNRKRAAQRAAERNAARDRGQTGNVPGVGYVSPRRERETYTDESGQERHKSGARMPKKEDQKESFDLFDYLLEYLVAEGYADTNKAALAIMANMSEEWRESIVEETLDERNRGEQGMSDREVIRRRNLGGNTRSTVSSGALGDHGSQGAIQKFHKGKQKIRQAIHKSGRYTRGDTGESGGKGRYEANKDHADGYPSITKRGQGPD